MTSGVRRGLTSFGNRLRRRQKCTSHSHCATPEIITAMASACAPVGVSGPMTEGMIIRQRFMITGVAATAAKRSLLFKMPPSSDTSEMKII